MLVGGVGSSHLSRTPVCIFRCVWVHPPGSLRMHITHRTYVYLLSSVIALIPSCDRGVNARDPTAAHRPLKYRPSNFRWRKAGTEYLPPLSDSFELSLPTSNSSPTAVSTLLCVEVLMYSTVLHMICFMSQRVLGSEENVPTGFLGPNSNVPHKGDPSQHSATNNTRDHVWILRRVQSAAIVPFLVDSVVQQ